MEQTLPRIEKNPRRWALNQTFVRPVTREVAWRFQQFTPKQIAYNIAQSNALGQAYLDYRFNYKLATTPGGTEGYLGNIAGPKPGAGTPYSNEFQGQQYHAADRSDGGDSNSGLSAARNASVVRVVGDTIDRGFNSLSAQLRQLVQSVLLLGKSSNQNVVESKKTAEKVTELVEVIKVKPSDKFSQRETELETGKANVVDEPDEKSDPGKGIFAKILGAVLGRVGGLIRAAVVGGGGILAGAGGLIAGILGGISLPMVAGAAAALFGVFKFIKGWSETDGDMIQKMMGGLKSTIFGFVKLTSDVFKTGARAIKGTITAILDFFGADKMAKKLKSFDLGKWWDGMFDKLVHAFTPTTDILSKMGELVLRSFAKMLAKLVENVLPPEQAKKTEEFAKKAEAQVNSAMDSINNFMSESRQRAGNAFESAANTTQAAVEAAKERVRPSKDNSMVYGAAQQEVAETLKAGGLTPNVVAGFMGNFHVEGGYGGAQGDGRSAGGIAQWRKERRDAFVARNKRDPTKASFKEQAEHVLWELTTPEGRKVANISEAQANLILNAESPEQAAFLIDKYFERSSKQHTERRMRAAVAAAEAIANNEAKQEESKTKPKISLASTNIPYTKSVTMDDMKKLLPPKPAGQALEQKITETNAAGRAMQQTNVNQTNVSAPIVNNTTVRPSAPKPAARGDTSSFSTNGRPKP